MFSVTEDALDTAESHGERTRTVVRLGILWQKGSRLMRKERNLGISNTGDMSSKWKKKRRNWFVKTKILHWAGLNETKKWQIALWATDRATGYLRCSKAATRPSFYFLLTESEELKDCPGEIVRRRHLSLWRSLDAAASTDCFCKASEHSWGVREQLIEKKNQLSRDTGIEGLMEEMNKFWRNGIPYRIRFR